MLIIYRLTLVLVAFNLGLVSSAQNLLPKVLIDIHNTSDFPYITKTVQDLGFTPQSVARDSASVAKVSTWYFQPTTQPGDQVSSVLTKSINSDDNSKTVLCLYNAFYYKQFVKSLIDNNYKLREANIIEGRCYYVFKNKRSVFTLSEKHFKGELQYFEIVLETEQ